LLLLLLLLLLQCVLWGLVRCIVDCRRQLQFDSVWLGSHHVADLRIHSRPRWSFSLLAYVLMLCPRLIDW